MKTNKSKKMRSFIILAISIFTVTISMYFYSPVLRTSAVGNYADVDVSVRSVISLTTDVSSVNFDITPTSAGVFDSKPVVATVTTNSSTGYELYFSSIDNETDMTSEDSNETIKSDFSGTVTSSTMAKNKWAYSLDNTNFSKIPTLASAVKVQDLDHIPTSSEGTTTFNIATKIDNTIAPGAYYKKVLISALAHGQVPRESMQTFSCSELINVGDSMILMDSRDDNEYTVKRLADGNCWMTQNLRIAGRQISGDDSDMQEGTTFTIPNSNLSSFATDYNTGEEINTAGAYVDPTWGGYYSFYTATAGTGGISVISGNATSSICPKGWRLPTGGQNGEYATLINTYNSVSSLASGPSLDLSERVDLGQYIVPYSDEGYQYLGFFWSSTAHSDKEADALRIFNDQFDNREIIGIYHSIKVMGHPVRCIAR